MPLTMDDIRRMSPEEIAANWEEIGRILAEKPKRPEPAPPGELTLDHLRWMTPEEIGDRWGEVSQLMWGVENQTEGENEEND